MRREMPAILTLHQGASPKGCLGEPSAVLRDAKVAALVPAGGAPPRVDR